MRNNLKQKISTTALANFQQSKKGFSAGAGHARMRNRETGFGTNKIQIQRSLLRVNAQLQTTVDPGLRVQLLNAQAHLQNQLLRSTGAGTGGQDGSPVPHVTTGYTWDGGVVEPYDASVISPFAAFQLTGTRRMDAVQLPPSPNRATPGGFPAYPGGSWGGEKPRIKTVNNPEGSQIGQTSQPGDIGNLPTTHRAKVSKKRPPYIPGVTMQQVGRNGVGETKGFNIWKRWFQRGKSGQRKTAQAQSTGTPITGGS
jgi:hypothetical protein